MLMPFIFSIEDLNQKTLLTINFYICENIKYMYKHHHKLELNNIAKLAFVNFVP